MCFENRLIGLPRQCNCQTAKNFSRITVFRYAGQSGPEFRDSFKLPTHLLAAQVGEARRRRAYERLKRRWLQSWNQRLRCDSTMDRIHFVDGVSAFFVSSLINSTKLLSLKCGSTYSNSVNTAFVSSDHLQILRNSGNRRESSI